MRTGGTVETNKSNFSLDKKYHPNFIFFRLSLPPTFDLIVLPMTGIIFSFLFSQIQAHKYKLTFEVDKTYFYK